MRKSQRKKRMMAKQAQRRVDLEASRIPVTVRNMRLSIRTLNLQHFAIEAIALLKGVYPKHRRAVRRKNWSPNAA